MGHFVRITSSIHTNSDYSDCRVGCNQSNLGVNGFHITEVAYHNQTKPASTQILLFAPYYLLYSIDPLWNFADEGCIFNSSSFLSN